MKNKNLWTYFTTFSIVSIVDFERNVSWSVDNLYKKMFYWVHVVNITESVKDYKASQTKNNL